MSTEDNGEIPQPDVETAHNTDTGNEEMKARLAALKEQGNTTIQALKIIGLELLEHNSMMELSAAALPGIPNLYYLVEQTRDDYPRAWQHCHIEGDPEAWDFIILLAKRAYAVNKAFGINGKRGGDDWSWDALNWRGDPSYDPNPNVIDCVAGAGGSNPQPAWQVTNTTGKWFDPTQATTFYNYGNEGGGNGGGDGGGVDPNQLPSYVEVGGDEAGTLIGQYLFYDYSRGGQDPNAGMGVWFYRTAYDAIAGLDYNASIQKHRAEWCAALGIPVDNWTP